MQNTNAYVATEGREETPNEGKAAQQLEQIMASGLAPLYRRAYRILGNASDAEGAVQDALLAAYTHLYQFRQEAQWRYFLFRMRGPEPRLSPPLDWRVPGSCVA